KAMQSASHGACVRRNRDIRCSRSRDCAIIAEKPARRTLMSVHPSGEQWEITHGNARATVVEVGGGIREYARDGIDILDPFPLDAMCDGAHNMPLVPWPNRIEAGRYTF